MSDEEQQVAVASPREERSDRREGKQDTPRKESDGPAGESENDKTDHQMTSFPKRHQEGGDRHPYPPPPPVAPSRPSTTNTTGAETLSVSSEAPPIRPPREGEGERPTAPTPTWARSSRPASSKTAFQSSSSSVVDATEAAGPSVRTGHTDAAQRKRGGRDSSRDSSGQEATVTPRGGPSSDPDSEGGKRREVAGHYPFSEALQRELASVAETEREFALSRMTRVTLDDGEESPLVTQHEPERQQQQQLKDQSREQKQQQRNPQQQNDRTAQQLNQQQGKKPQQQQQQQQQQQLQEEQRRQQQPNQQHEQQQQQHTRPTQLQKQQNQDPDSPSDRTGPDKPARRPNTRSKPERPLTRTPSLVGSRLARENSWILDSPDNRPMSRAPADTSTVSTAMGYYSGVSTPMFQENIKIRPQDIIIVNAELVEVQSVEGEEKESDAENVETHRSEEKKSQALEQAKNSKQEEKVKESKRVEQTQKKREEKSKEDTTSVQQNKTKSQTKTVHDKTRRASKQEESKTQKTKQIQNKETKMRRQSVQRSEDEYSQEEENRKETVRQSTRKGKEKTEEIQNDSSRKTKQTERSVREEERSKPTNQETVVVSRRRSCASESHKTSEEDSRSRSDTIKSTKAKQSNEQEKQTKRQARNSIKDIESVHEEQRHLHKQRKQIYVEEESNVSQETTKSTSTSQKREEREGVVKEKTTRRKKSVVKESEHTSSQDTKRQEKTAHETEQSEEHVDSDRGNHTTATRENQKTEEIYHFYREKNIMDLQQSRESDRDHTIEHFSETTEKQQQSVSKEPESNRSFFITGYEEDDEEEDDDDDDDDNREDLSESNAHPQTMMVKTNQAEQGGEESMRKKAERENEEEEEEEEKEEEEEEEDEKQQQRQQRRREIEEVEQEEEQQEDNDVNDEEDCEEEEEERKEDEEKSQKQTITNKEPQERQKIAHEQTEEENEAQEEEYEQENYTKSRDSDTKTIQDNVSQSSKPGSIATSDRPAKKAASNQGSDDYEPTHEERQPKKPKVLNDEHSMNDAERRHETVADHEKRSEVYDDGDTYDAEYSEERRTSRNPAVDDDSQAQETKDNKRESDISHTQSHTIVKEMKRRRKPSRRLVANDDDNYSDSQLTFDSTKDTAASVRSQGKEGEGNAHTAKTQKPDKRKPSTTGEAEVLQKNKNKKTEEHNENQDETRKGPRRDSVISVDEEKQRKKRYSHPAIPSINIDTTDTEDHHETEERKLKKNQSKTKQKSTNKQEPEEQTKTGPKEKSTLGSKQDKARRDSSLSKHDETGPPKKTKAKRELPRRDSSLTKEKTVAGGEKRTTPRRDSSLTRESTFFASLNKRDTSRRESSVTREKTNTGPQTNNTPRRGSSLIREKTNVGKKQTAPRRDSSLTRENTQTGPKRNRDARRREGSLTRENTYAAPSQNRNVQRRDSSLTRENTYAAPTQNRNARRESSLTREQTYAAPTQNRNARRESSLTRESTKTSKDTPRKADPNTRAKTNLKPKEKHETARPDPSTSRQESDQESRPRHKEKQKREPSAEQDNSAPRSDQETEPRGRSRERTNVGRTSKDKTERRPPSLSRHEGDTHLTISHKEATIHDNETSPSPRQNTSRTKAEQSEPKASKRTGLDTNDQRMKPKSSPKPEVEGDTSRTKHPSSFSVKELTLADTDVTRVGKTPNTKTTNKKPQSRHVPSVEQNVDVDDDDDDDDDGSVTNHRSYSERRKTPRYQQNNKGADFHEAEQELRRPISDRRSQSRKDTNYQHHAEEGSDTEAEQDSHIPRGRQRTAEKRRPTPRYASDVQHVSHEDDTDVHMNNYEDEHDDEDDDNDDVTIESKDINARQSSETDQRVTRSQRSRKSDDHTKQPSDKARPSDEPQNNASEGTDRERYSADTHRHEDDTPSHAHTPKTADSRKLNQQNTEGDGNINSDEADEADDNDFDDDMDEQSRKETQFYGRDERNKEEMPMTYSETKYEFVPLHGRHIAKVSTEDKEISHTETAMQQTGTSRSGKDPSDYDDTTSPQEQDQQYSTREPSVSRRQISRASDNANAGEAERMDHESHGNSLNGDAEDAKQYQGSDDQHSAIRTPRSGLAKDVEDTNDAIQKSEHPSGRGATDSQEVNERNNAARHYTDLPRQRQQNTDFNDADEENDHEIQRETNEHEYNDNYSEGGPIYKTSRSQRRPHKQNSHVSEENDARNQDDESAAPDDSELAEENNTHTRILPDTQRSRETQTPREHFFDSAEEQDGSNLDDDDDVDAAAGDEEEYMSDQPPEDNANDYSSSQNFARKPVVPKRMISKISEEDVLETKSSLGKTSHHPDSEDEGDNYVPLTLRKQRQPMYTNVLDERGTETEGTPREQRHQLHEFGPRTPGGSEPATPRERAGHGDSAAPDGLFREPSMVRISEEGERMVLQSSEGTEQEAGKGFANRRSFNATEHDLRKPIRQRHYDDDEDEEEEEEEPSEEEDDDEEEEEDNTFPREDPEGRVTNLRPWTVEESDGDDDEEEDLNDLMILQKLPRDDLDYAQKIYRQLGLDSESPAKPRRTPRKDKLATPRGDSDQSSPLKSSSTSAFKSLQSTPRKSRNPSRQQTSDASPRLRPKPPPSRKTKTRQGKKRDRSPREGPESHVPNTMTAAQFMARMGLMKSQTSLSELARAGWTRPLHAQRPISRSATDLRPMREDSNFCVTNFRQRSGTTANMRSEVSDGRRRQREFFKEELRRLEGNLKKESSKIVAPERKKHTPFVFNTLEPYYNTWTPRYLIELPDEGDPQLARYSSRNTAQGLTDPWIDLRMDTEILPQIPTASRPTTRNDNNNKLRGKPKAKKGSNSNDPKRKEGSTRLPKFPVVTLETKDLATKQLFYSDVPMLRKELKTKYSSQARSKVDADYQRTRQDFYRMDLDRLDQVAPANRPHLTSTYRAYLQNTPGSRRAVQDCIKTLEGKAS